MRTRHTPAKHVLTFPGAPRPLFLCDPHKDKAMTTLLDEGKPAVCAPSTRGEPCAVCAVEKALKMSRLKEEAMLPRPVQAIKVPVSTGPTGTLKYEHAKDLGEITPGQRLILLPDPIPGSSTVYVRAFPMDDRTPSLTPTTLDEWTRFPGTTRLIEAAHSLLSTVHLSGRGLLITLSHF